MVLEYRSDELRTYAIAYHLAWAVKRGKKVLRGRIAQDCRKLIEMKCAERGWTVLLLDVLPGYVQLHVQVWPTTSAFEVVKECKGLTSHELRLKYPALLRLPSLWTRAYFASTEESVKDTQIEGFVGVYGCT